MPKKWINTKVDFTWDSKEQKYIETDVEGYIYSGPIAECGHFCFLGDTKILMSDHSYKNIEDIEIGDEVISWDEANDKIITDKVVGIKTPIHNDFVKISVDGKDDIICTHDHPFLVKDKGWSSYNPQKTMDNYGGVYHFPNFEDTFASVEPIQVDDIVFVHKDGDGSGEREGGLVETKITNIEEHKVNNASNRAQTYIFETELYHTFFAEDVLTHNKGAESIGAGEAVMTSGSAGLTDKAQVSMSIGDKVLSANITGLPDSDLASEYLLWEYTGSDITSQVTVATSSVTATGSGQYVKWVSMESDNGRDNPLTMTPNHTILTWIGSSYPNTGSWYFEYAGDVVAGMKFLSSSMEVIDVTKWTYVTSSVSQSFYRTNIEPHDVYFIDGVLVHN